MERLRRLARKGALSVVSVGVALLVLEALFRLVGASFSPPPLYPGDIQAVIDKSSDPLIGWKLPPSSVASEEKEEYRVSYTANALGFRSTREFVPESTSRPVLFLGDSYTFGSGVRDDETFVSVLERRLGGVPCFNMGIGGFGIDQMWMTLKHYGLALKPRAVVLSFVRADLDRCLSAYRLGSVWRAKPTFCLENGELVPLTASNSPAPLPRLLEQKSRVVALWRRTQDALSMQFPVGYRWRLNRAMFEKTREECLREDVPLLVVHIPINRRNSLPMFKQEFEKMNLPLLDLTERLPTNPEALYYPKDHHLTAAGHRWVAEEIEKALRARGV